MSPKPTHCPTCSAAATMAGDRFVAFPCGRRDILVSGKWTPQHPCQRPAPAILAGTLKQLAALIPTVSGPFRVAGVR